MSKEPDKKKIEELLASKKRHEDHLTHEDLFQRLKKGDQQALSESITLLESTRKEHQDKAQHLILSCLPHTGKSIRVGITGVPGVGKSSFIEKFGLHLISQGKKVAVLAVDPSSERSGGSILGDKTRMNALSVHENAFIRPSASRGSLGGVARKTRESILLCEAAGFDVILIETVGVGQSETAVHSMTDFFLLLMLSGAGDELQGIKRGIMEMADMILITKADGENVKKSNLARSQYASALHLFPPAENGWSPCVETISSMENRGMDKAWQVIKDFRSLTADNASFVKKREQQQLFWFRETLHEKVLNHFYSQQNIAELIKELENQLITGQLTSYQAADQIIERLNHE